MDKIKVLVADSYDIYRRGLHSVLTGYGKFTLFEAAKNGKELISAFKKNPDSLCLISSNIADANIHDLLLKLRKINEDVPVIVLTYSTDISHLNQSLKAGVKGYLTKNCTSDELIQSVLTVANGEQAFSKSISQLMIGRYADQAKKTTSKPVRQITKREREILKLIVEGYTSPEIAKILYISTRTVETHRSNLMNKLELKNTAALVRFALEEANIT
ncbi:response regulator transcription factor [Rhodohalobacter mucosus]|nr:response regulator transcription factor [Rhodohalobacter mucosus]